jgi:hypothetical protein
MAGLHVVNLSLVKQHDLTLMLRGMVINASTSVVHHVDLTKLFCPCGEWQVTMYPCRHVCVHILNLKSTLNPEQCVPDYLMLQRCVANISYAMEEQN